MPSPYTSPDGITYESYEAYCNSSDLELYVIMLKLHAGLRAPQNDFERGLLREMKEMEERSEHIDFSEATW